MQLPMLRQELSVLPGPSLADGQPSHTLHDPVRNRYFQLDWPTFEIIARWALGTPASIAQRVNDETTLTIEATDVENVAQFLADNELLEPAIGSSNRLAARASRLRGTWWQQLLHNYLFFRIPLWRPDAWLSRMAPAFRIFYSRGFRWLTVLALLIGMIEIGRDWDRFAATLVDTFSLRGLIGYGLALFAVKFAHELGHAITAKRYGCRIPTMGVAFLVLWPVAYTDTNDVWQLRSRRQRLAVAAAGVLTELTIAAWATFLWAWLPDGLPKSIAFLLATTTWISTILVNASPFMRFDGYFLLADYLELPNLHARSFALARWHLREVLFDLGDEPPEYFRSVRQRGLIVFAWAVWIYRLVLFLGIAALVYHFFIKAVGIVLFIIEIGVFVLLPVMRELREWKKLWPRLRHRRRTWISAGVGALFLLFFVLPLPTRVHTSALLQPQQRFVIYAPDNAQIERLPFGEGQKVGEGDVLVVMTSPKLQWRERSLTARLQQTRWQASAGAFNAEQRAHWQSSQAENAAALAEIDSAATTAERYAPKAPFAGVIRDIDPELQPGQWVTTHERLGVLVQPGRQEVIAYVDEQAANGIRPGARAAFFADNGGLPRIALRVVRVDADASRILTEPPLASRFGGDLLVRESKNVLYPERVLYRVTLEPDASGEALDSHIWRGSVSIQGGWAPPGSRFVKAALALIWREAGF